MTPLDVLPPDLEMRIRIAAEHGKTRLRFILHSPNGRVALSHREIDGPLLQRDPEEYQGHLLSKIEKLGEGVDVDRSLLLQAEIESRLASLGHDLWRELFPSELRAAYRDVIRPSVRSWVIVSDEPWIPWELVKPYDDSGPGEALDDDFLCLRFELTRWLAGRTPFVPAITVRTVAVLQSAPELPHAPQERTIFTRLKESFPGLVACVPRLDSAADFLGFVASTQADLLHLIGHGIPMTLHPDEAGIPFPDKSVLRPADLHGTLATHLRRTRPLIFLNACWAAKEGWSLTRLGGWAARWIDVCGCGALVAPLWPVRDETALAFAWSFYEALARGTPLGQAALQARRQVHSQRPGDPSVLAYTIYGHPNAAVSFREATSLVEAPAAAGASSAPRWRPRRRIPRRLKSFAATCGVALLLALATRPLPNLLFPVDPVPKPLAPPVPRKKVEAPSSPPRAETRVETCASIKGLRFELSGAQAGVRYSLKTALCRLAEPLREAGLSGWTVVLAVDPPEVEPVAQGSTTLQSCRITAQATARGPKSRLDFGPVRGVNAQFNRSIACEEAAVSLAETVISRLTAALPQEGVP